MQRNGLIMLTVALLAGCSGITVSQDYEPTTNFESLRTFAWSSETQENTGDPRIDNPLRVARIRAAVERLLADKGFLPATVDAPGFLIRYQETLRRKIESDGAGGGIGFGIGSYGRHGGIAIGTGGTVREYEAVSLVIDVTDATGALLWRGTGTQRFREYDDPAKATEDIDALVAKILEQFPPQS